MTAGRRPEDPREDLRAERHRPFATGARLR